METIGLGTLAVELDSDTSGVVKGMNVVGLFRLVVRLG